MNDDTLDELDFTMKEAEKVMGFDTVPEIWKKYGIDVIATGGE